MSESSCDYDWIENYIDNYYWSILDEDERRLADIEHRRALNHSIFDEDDFEFLVTNNIKPCKKTKQNKKKERLLIVAKKIKRENCKLLRKLSNKNK